jgi:hypothetical protein
MLRAFLGWIFLSLSCTSAFSTVISATVDGRVRPWDFAPVVGGQNSDFVFGGGDGGNLGLAPVVIDSGSGLSFAPGGALTITRTGGLTSAFDGPPTEDGLGYFSLGPANDNPGSSGGPFPSTYTPADWDTNLMALMGTFADASGNIVGTPFEIGNGRSVIIPVGASQLQLGLNDDIFDDNTGALNLRIADDRTVTPVPSPGTVALLAPALLLMLRKQRRRS